VGQVSPNFMQVASKVVKLEKKLKTEMSIISPKKALTLLKFSLIG
jgi:hypothetical protein